MTDDSSSRAPFAESEQERTVVSYRRTSGLAVTAILLAAVSGVALATWVLWWVPCAAVFVSALALYQLRKDPGLRGRRMVVVGLTVAVVIGASAPVRFFARSQRVTEQAELAGLEWLEMLRTSQYEDGQVNDYRLAKALEMTLPIDKRQRFDPSSLTEYYLGDEGRREVLEQFANEKLVHTLHLLGSRATVRYFSTESCRQEAEVDRVTSVCVVTFLRSGRTESFFVKLDLERKHDAYAPQGNWRVVKYRGHMPEDISLE